MSNFGLSNLLKIASSASNQAYLGGGSGSASYPLFRNLVINPDFAIDQRNNGSPQIITSDYAAYGPDRLIASINTGGANFQYTLQQQLLGLSDSTALGGIDTSCRLTTNSNVTFAGTSNNVGLYHMIEGNNTSMLYWGNSNGNSATFQMWIKTNVTGTHHVSFHNSAYNMSYVAPFNVASNNTWSKQVISIPVPTTGTWKTDNNAGVIINIDNTCSGQTTASTNTWLSGYYTCPTTYSSSLWKVAANYVDITALQFENGKDTPYETRNSSYELALCQKYFESSMHPYSKPQNNTSTIAPGTSMYLQGQYGTSFVYFKQTKLGNPIMTFYNPYDTTGVAYNNDTFYTSSTLSPQNVNVNGFSVSSSDTSLQNSMTTFNWTADSEYGLPSAPIFRTLGSPTITYNTVTYPLAGYIIDRTGSITYTLTANPNANASITSGILSVAGAFRNSTYTVTVKATNGLGLFASSSLSVTEPAASAPTFTSLGSVGSVATNTVTYTLSSYVTDTTNSTLTYSFTANPYSNASITSGVLSVVGATRNSTYTVTVKVTNGYSMFSTSSLSITEITSTPLYSFTSFTFTNAGITGKTGPILSQCTSAYSAQSWATNTSYFNMTTQGIQRWTVPTNGDYTITVAGAKGGNNTSYGPFTGGYGALMIGGFSLNVGNILQLLVGQSGVNAPAIGGGGGGSFVVSNSNTPLIIAGGGGGAEFANSSFGASNKQATTSTTANPGISIAASAVNAYGGSNGSGGGDASSGSGGGGGGLTGNGYNILGSGVGPGIAFINGGLGGAGAGTSANDGGFGGGGGGEWSVYSGGGGGGGYSGGGWGKGGGVGGGAGSYNNGYSQTNTGGTNTDVGYITIQYLAPLYSFSTFTFTNAGATGRTGPILSACVSAYSSASWASNTSYLNMTTQGIQLWTVPSTGSYTLTVAGAKGGDCPQPAPSTWNYSYIGGNGRIVTGTTNLTRGQVLQIVVGQIGITNTGSPGYAYKAIAAAGGGGTFIIDNATGNPILIAGGGGGSAHDGANSRGANGGDAPSSSGNGAGGTYGAWGTVQVGAGGVGWNSDGADSPGATSGGPTGGRKFTGGAKSTAGSDPLTCASDGGFGGGGATAAGGNYTGGAGGGGYTGGNGANPGSAGTGAGSYIGSIGSYGSTNNGFGYVTITPNFIVTGPTFTSLGSVGSVTTNTVTYTLSSYVTDTTNSGLTYSLTANPNTNATITSGVLSVVGNYRNSTYTITVKVTNGVGLSATSSLSVTEIVAPAPTFTSLGSVGSVTTNTVTYTLSSYVTDTTGTGLTYSLTANPNSNATITSGVLSVVGATRNSTYTVTVQVTNGYGMYATSSLSVTEVSAGNGLYAFTAFTFTNASVTGRTGPILSQCVSAYSSASWASNTSYFNMTTQGIQLWTVPATGSYTIECFGASGATSGGTGGIGAQIRGTFSLTQGVIIGILVGQMGGLSATNPACNAGGGGGTYVWNTNSTTEPLIVAGGGGGGNGSASYPGGNANTATNGTGSLTAAVAGTNGNGASPGGSGWKSNGTPGLDNNNDQCRRPLEGGFGGLSLATITVGNGGFGGGASASGQGCGNGGPGGGGGYSGGEGPSSTAESLASGGGGSYNGGSSQVNAIRSGAGDGYLTITPNFTITVGGGGGGYVFSKLFDNVTNICSDWQTYCAGLAASYNSVTLSGTYDSTGRTTTNSTIATGLAAALKGSTSYSAYDSATGYTWAVGECNGRELSVGVSATICTCDIFYTIRPCCNAPTNYSSIDGVSTCNSPVQTITLTFNTGGLPSAMSSSTILASRHATAISTLLPSKTFTLLYRGSIDGFATSTFHTKCDNQGSTFCVFKSTAGYIVTAFVNVSWDTSGGYKAATSGTCWLNNLENSSGTISTTQYLNTGSPEYTIFCSTGYGPTFGHGHDLKIIDPINGGGGYTYTPYAYVGSGLTNTLLFGTYSSWVLSDIEVYKVV